MRLQRRWSAPVIAVVLAAGLLTVASTVPAAAGSDSATPPSWSAAPTVLQGELSGVSCVGTHFCAAVGGTGIGDDPTLIEMWNGHKWTFSPSPPVAGVLRSVSCVSAARCEAVGGRDGKPGKPLIESWNGVRWTVRSGFAAPGGGDADLLGVSCATSTSCLAAGRFFNGARDQAFVARWNGRRWTGSPLPLPGSGWATQLLSVSCPSPTRCFAVGGAFPSANPPGGAGTLIETWDGHQWSVMPAPTTGNTGGDPPLSDVSCSDPNSCVAVGQLSPDGLLTERFDGTRWTVEQSPALRPRGPDRVVEGLSCISRTSCVAVGWAYHHAGSPPKTRALILSFDGRRWSAVTPGPQPPVSTEQLYGVSCSPEHCAAVGARWAQVHTTAQTLAISGSIPRRSVSVSWTPAENARLRQIAAYLHRTPAATQKAAVYAFAYLLSLEPKPATSVKLPVAGAVATYTTVWNQPELAVLDAVRMHLGTRSVGATRASVYLFSYLLALAGH